MQWKDKDFSKKYTPMGETQWKGQYNANIICTRLGKRRGWRQTTWCSPSSSASWWPSGSWWSAPTSSPGGRDGTWSAPHISASSPWPPLGIISCWNNRLYNEKGSGHLSNMFVKRFQSCLSQKSLVGNGEGSIAIIDYRVNLQVQTMGLF